MPFDQTTKTTELHPEHADAAGTSEAVMPSAAQNLDRLWCLAADLLHGARGLPVMRREADALLRMLGGSEGDTSNAADTNGSES